MFSNSVMMYTVKLYINTLVIQWIKVSVFYTLYNYGKVFYMLYFRMILDVFNMNIKSIIPILFIFFTHLSHVYILFPQIINGDKCKNRV